MFTPAIASRIFIFAHRSVNWDKSYSEEIQAQLRKIGLSVLRVGNLIIGHDEVLSHVPVDGKVLLIDVYPGTANYLRKVWSTMPSDTEGIRRLLVHDAQVFNMFYFNSDSFTIFSDFLAIKPLHAFETDHYMAIASKITDLRDVLNVSLSETDPLGIAELIYFGMPLEKRTIHKRVFRLPAAEKTQWSQSEGFVAQDISLPDTIASISLKLATKRINEAFVESVNRKLSKQGSTNLIALSGGFDSRLIAAKLKELGAPIYAYTYGESYHSEVKVAKKIAKALKIDHMLLPYPHDNYIKNIYHHIEAMEGQCETHSTQMCNLLRIDTGRGGTLFIGFFGEALQGDHLKWLQEDDNHTLDRIAEDIFFHHRDIQLDNCVAQLGLSISRDDILHALYRSLGKKYDGYSALLLWDWTYRQRRYVGSHFALLGHRFRLVAPFYDLRVVKTWAAVPRIGLDERFLLRKIMEIFHPTLAEIPHTYEKFPIRPNIQAQLSLIASELPIKILKTLNLKEMVKRIVPRRDPVIHRLSKGATTFKQRLLTIERIKEFKPSLYDQLSLSLNDRFLEAYLSKSDLLNSELAVLRKLFGLGLYAKWLSEKKSFI